MTTPPARPRATRLSASSKDAAEIFPPAAVGRPGRFRYTNQDHSLEMGILAARSILDKRRHNIEDVGKEQEYFERGYTPSR